MAWYFSNPNITCDIIQSNIDKPWNWVDISEKEFNYHKFFQSRIYRERETHKMMTVIKEELISKACHPKRILWYDENISTNSSLPLYGLTQKEIDNLLKEELISKV